MLSMAFIISFAEKMEIKSPDNNLSVTIELTNSGELFYNVVYKDNLMLENSPLGLVTDVSDFSKSLKLISTTNSVIDKKYEQDRIKKANIHYQANEIVWKFANAQNHHFNVVFQVSNNNIAYKYELMQDGETARCTIENELSGFKFPTKTTTFLTPQATPMIGWKRTKPSYEEEYEVDQPLGKPSKYGVGFTFPSLFKIGDDGWVLISETGVGSNYCASKLSEGTKDGLYKIAFPEPEENNGVGSANPSIPLPGETPWRTLTVGEDLKPIVETTIPFDVVDPLYEPSIEYKMGRSTWSWIMWQDYSMNFDDQITYMDFAADMGYEYILVDALWDKQVGYEKMPELFKYAQSKGVDIFLWYNSNGYWNDAPQGPKQRMNSSITRKAEMKWLKELGVKGLKVDFFGGDKQETMKLYEEILSDANDYGLMVIFHGCTLPRGWERMYPNYVGSEAVLASENLIFTQKSNDDEAFSATLHPFIRNSVGIMEFGPVLLNKRHNRNNDGGTTRITTETFQLATAVLFQSPVQMFAIAPNNLVEQPEFVMDFMKNVPTTWEETLYIDGYPGKYAIIARKHNGKWYVVGVNAEKKVIKKKIKLPMINSSTLSYYSDDNKRNPKLNKVKLNKSKTVQITMQPDGAFILTE